MFSKPYFDPAGLILALRDGVPVGFVHAGFGPNEGLSNLRTETGIISALRVVEHDDVQATAAGLLDRAVDYLRSHGSQECFAGAAFPFAPFYLGLYGGSRIPGVLDDDLTTRAAFLASGFAPQEEILIFQRRLAGFRAIVDRQQMQVRRQYQVQSDSDPTSTHWWDACTLGSTMRTRFVLHDRRQSRDTAMVTFWDMQPLASCWGVVAMGLYDLQVAAEARRCGLGTFLVCESLRALSQQGVSLVEAQVRQVDAAGCNMFGKLGFEVVGTGHTLRREL